eukprot:TRINITY_DN2408_c0_g3_i1.p1 TRINITY_DN2408_c0_g3~~TRINITY_DN2408_c0_g3_i1.p1  ORF type:complete len:554 (+),score=100.92 TRINITY_DN2408_c0_g3_i1:86-1747(+)
MGCASSTQPPPGEERSSGSSRGVDTSGLQSTDLEVLRKALHEAHLRHDKGSEVKDAEARLRDEAKLPSDWDLESYCAGKFLEGAFGGRQSSTVVSLHKQPPQMERAMQELFDGTQRKVYTRDRRGAPIPDRFVVKDVKRVLNGEVWREYCVQRETVRQQCAGHTPKVPGGAQTMNHLEAKGLTSVLPALDKDANEVWLFHGTTAEAAIGIAENDFRLDLTGSNAGTLYGKGIYLAEHASKSDEYGEGPKGPAGEEMEMGYEAPRPPPGPPPPLVRESYMLVCRSLLGRVNYNDEQRPDANRLQQSCTTGDYHSVLGDRLKLNGTFRETVVFHDDHVYPEFIVKYERIFFHEHFARVYEQMLNRREANRFNGPTAEETEVLRSMWSVYSMPNKGYCNKWQLLDLLMAICQPPADEGDDLDETFAQWDTKKDGKLDYDEFLAEVTERVNQLIYCSGPSRFGEHFNQMCNRAKAGEDPAPTVAERGVLRMVWYTYVGGQEGIDKMGLLGLLKGIDQPPANETTDLEETFKEINTTGSGLITFEEFVKEMEQRARDY